MNAEKDTIIDQQEKRFAFQESLLDARSNQLADTTLKLIKTEQKLSALKAINRNLWWAVVIEGIIIVGMILSR